MNKVMRTKKLNKSRVNEILQKAWIDRNEFKELVGIETTKGNYLFNLIRDKIKNDLDKKNMELPDTKHIPLGKTLQYLKHYGITFQTN